MGEAVEHPERGTDPFVLSIDVGSSSVRAIVYDRCGRPMESLAAHRPYSLHTDEQGAAEADPDTLVRLVGECLDDVVRSIHGAGVSVAAVACDTFWHTLVGVDGSARAITPVYTWADTRSHLEVWRLREQFDEDDVHQRTGAPFHSSYLPAKLLWLRDTQRERFESARFWMSIAEYLYLQFFGVRRASISIASATGLMDQRSCTWDPELMDFLRVAPDHLSPIAEYTDALRGPTRDYAQRWPALNDIPWYLPVGDGASSNIGCGAVSEDRIALMVGTSGAMRCIRSVDDFHTPRGLWTYRVDARRIIQGGALSEGGNVFAWLTSTLRTGSREGLDSRLAAMEPDSHGLTLLPFFTGERSPHWRSEARSTFHGMRLDTQPESIVRAALEAIALRFVLVYRLLVTVVPDPSEVIASGGGLLHSPAWMQIISDALARPIHASGVDEASCRGAALLALEALGAIDDYAHIPFPETTLYQPNAAHAQAYERALARQQELEQRLLDFDSAPERNPRLRAEG